MYNKCVYVCLGENNSEYMCVRLHLCTCVYEKETERREYRRKTENREIKKMKK